MKISEYIAQLQAIQHSCGDLPVKTCSSGNGGMVNARSPQIEYAKLLGPRDSVVRIWYRFDDEAQKGEKVVRV